MEKRLLQYRRILKRDPALARVSEKLYREPAKGSVFGVPGQAALAHVLAPVICLYTAWVLENALKEGISRLYFLARDGYAMHEAAQVLCRELGLPIECRYLYCSRHAWRSAEYPLLGEKALEYVCLGGCGVTFRMVAGRAGLSPEETREAGRLLGMEDTMDDPLSRRSLGRLPSVLAGCEPFIKAMARHGERAFPAACGYLEQEGLLEPVSWALVDSGWTGSMQESLRRLLEALGSSARLRGYYFGMYSRPRGTDPEAYRSWYFGPEAGALRKAYFSNSFLECVCSSPEGTTAGYKREGGRWGPVLERVHSPNREKTGESTDWIRRCGTELARECGRGLLCRDRERDRKTVFLLLRLLMGRPRQGEAQEFGSWAFSDDVLGEAEGKLALPLSRGQIRGQRLLSRGVSLILGKDGDAPWSAWPEGCLRLSGAGFGEMQRCTVRRFALEIRRQQREKGLHR